MQNPVFLLLALLGTLSSAPLLAAPGEADAVRWVGRFSENPAGHPADSTAATRPPSPWQVQQLDPKVPATRYTRRLWDGVPAIEAHADASMALFARPLEIDLSDLSRLPMLCWRWRVDAPLKTADARTRAGDDFAARLYLSFTLADEHLGWGTRLQLRLARSRWGEQVPDAALSYVWDNRLPVDSVLANAYTARTQMWVLRSGSQSAGAWVTERRDVVADFARAFGHPPQRLHALALASDTDNTGESAHAGFADLHFVGREQPCQF